MKSFSNYYALMAILSASIMISSCGKSGVKPTPPVEITYVVSTFAGSATAGSADGTGTSASFSSPSCVTVSSSGDLYIGDFANSLVRKINLSSAAVTKFAGTGSQGLLNGPALSAKFAGTANIAFDKSGNLFVSDEENNCIREITSSGNVITVAGSGVAGFQDGTATTAQFNHPEGLVADGSGNLFVVDGNNNAVRKVVISSGVVSTLAGTGAQGFNDGAGATAIFHSPYGIAMDGSGNLYIADIVNNRIRKIVISTGVVSTFAGTGTQGLGNGPKASATFFFPAGVAFDSKGNLFVGEIRNYTIRKIATDGTVTTFAGTGSQGSTDGDPASASFYQPIGITFDSSDNLYVADEFNNKIRKISVKQQ